MLPLALAVLAVVLIGIYIVSYRNSVTHGAGMVKVLVAARDIPAGTEGILGGGRRLPEVPDGPSPRRRSGLGRERRAR